MKAGTLTFIDLFCGCGGLSLGFEKEGFNSMLANDIDKNSIDTFLHNRPGIDRNKVICDDIAKVLETKKNDLLDVDCTLVVGGPPCQGFSMANRQRLIDDPRNRLYKKFIEAVELINPKFILMENVKGMLRAAPQVLSDFEKIGYYAEHIILNVRDYGIPQNRERIFFIGTNIKKTPAENLDVIRRIISRIKCSQKSSEIPLQDALWGLRRLEAKTIKNDTGIESEKFGFTKDNIFYNEPVPEYILEINNDRIPKIVYNHKTRYNNERDIKIYDLLPQGGKSDHKAIQHIMPYKSRKHIFKDKFYKLIPTEPCKTITSHMKFDCHMYIHPFQSRGLTPREAARIQGFPDNYEFKGAFTQWYMQIGNSVPPLLAGVLANAIIKAGVENKTLSVLT